MDLREIIWSKLQDRIIEETYHRRREVAEGLKTEDAASLSIRKYAMGITDAFQDIFGIPVNLQKFEKMVSSFEAK